MLKHVLVPLDGSDLAFAALDVATTIVDPNCQITLVAAVQVPALPVYAVEPMVIVDQTGSTTAEDSYHDMKTYLDSVADSLRNQGFKPSVRVAMGEPSQIILQVADETNADLIIMSTHGRSGLGRWLFGSVANEVLSASKHPVLVVPSRNMKKNGEHTAPEAYSVH
jgi:nucleotide-binding universal stress UspA family protein